MPARSSSNSGPDSGSAPGPIEAGRWPDRLQAWVFEPGPRPRAHGLDVYDDLAQHYGFAEVVLTLLRGEPPTTEEGALFDAILSFCTPTTVAEAPAHCAVVARSCRARWPAVAATGAAMLAEQAQHLLAVHEPLLAWLQQPHAELPVALRCHDAHERQHVHAFARRLARDNVSLPVLEHDPSLPAVLLAAAHHCGLRRRDQLEAMLTIARLPGVLAEAMRPAGDLRAYPMDLPHFVHRPPASSPPTKPESNGG